MSETHLNRLYDDVLFFLILILIRIEKTMKELDRKEEDISSLSQKKSKPTMILEDVQHASSAIRPLREIQEPLRKLKVN